MDEGELDGPLQYLVELVEALKLKDVMSDLLLASIAGVRALSDIIRLYSSCEAAIQHHKTIGCCCSYLTAWGRTRLRWNQRMVEAVGAFVEEQ